MPRLTRRAGHRSGRTVNRSLGPDISPETVAAVASIPKALPLDGGGVGGGGAAAGLRRLSRVRLRGLTAPHCSRTLEKTLALQETAAFRFLLRPAVLSAIEFD